jgi:hypothetical protein
MAIDPQHFAHMAADGTVRFVYVESQVRSGWGAESGDTLDLLQAIDRVISLHRPSTEHEEGTGPYCLGCYEAGGYIGAPLWIDCPTLIALFGKDS